MIEERLREVIKENAGFYRNPTTQIEQYSVYSEGGKSLDNLMDKIMGILPELVCVNEKELFNLIAKEKKNELTFSKRHFLTKAIAESKSIIKLR